MTTTDHRVTEFARAKINLALHVTGQREDGYHLLDSLVVFPDIGDKLSAELSTTLRLQVTGPFSDDLPSDDPDNLVLKAVRGFAVTAGLPIPDIRFFLEKNLPVASGIGGGSADAAAALRLIARLTDRELPETERQRLALALGADVPVCLQQKAARMTGIGETITPAPALPAADIILVNPGMGVPTPAVFRAMEMRDNPPLPALPDRFDDLRQLAGYLAATRNDMQAAATGLCPDIAKVIESLSLQPDIALARMSGSGATCFGICDANRAHAIAAGLTRAHPNWWIASGSLS